MAIEFTPDLVSRLEYLSPWVTDPNTWRMWMDIENVLLNAEADEIIRALQEGQRVILEYSDVNSYYDAMELIKYTTDKIEFLRGLSSYSNQIAEQFSDSSTYVEAGDFASAMAQNFSNYINYLGAVVSNKINHVCTTIYKLLAEGDASYIVEDMRPAMLQIGALLTTSLPVTAAAIAPLLGFAVGYGLYSLNEEFWTKISQTLLPWCYPDTNVVPAPAFPVVDGTTGDVTGWQVYYPHDMILAFEQFLKDYGGGSAEDYWYINDFNGNPIRLGWCVYNNTLVPAGISSQLAVSGNQGNANFWSNYFPPSPIGFHVVRSSSGAVGGYSNHEFALWVRASFFVYQENNLRVRGWTDEISDSHLNVSYKSGGGHPTRPILQFKLSQSTPSQGIKVGEPTYNVWGPSIDASCTICEGDTPLDSYAYALTKLIRTSYTGDIEAWSPSKIFYDDYNVGGSTESPTYVTFHLLCSVWTYAGYFIPGGGHSYANERTYRVDIPITQTMWSDVTYERSPYNSSYDMLTMYGRISFREYMIALLNQVIADGYDVDLQLLKDVISPEVYYTGSTSDNSHHPNVGGQTSPYYQNPNSYQILSPWIHSVIHAVDSANVTDFQSTTSFLKYGSPITIDEVGFTEWEGQQVPDYTSGQIKIWSEYNPDTNTGKYTLYDPVTIPISDNPFVTSPPEVGGEPTDPTAPVETPEILPYLYPIAPPFQYPIEIQVPTDDPTLNPEYGRAPTEYPLTDPTELRDPQIPATEIYSPPITIKPPVPDPPIPPPLGVSPPISFPIEPIAGIVPIGQSGLIHVYNPTNAAMYNFGRWLWVTLADTTIDKIWNNPFDGVIGAFEIYCTPNEGNVETIRSGFLDSQIAAPVVTDRYVTINCGTIAVPEYYQNYLDYGPYTKTHIYLPFIGIHELDTDHIVGFSVNVTYHIDCYSGVCIAMITHAKKDYSATIYQFSGNCSNDIPLSGGSQAAIKAGQIQANANTFAGIAGAVTSAAGGIAAGAATGGIIGGIAGGLLGAAPSLLQTNAQNVGTYLGNKSSVQHSGTFSGNEGAMGIKKPYLIVERPVQKNVLNYNLEYGFPSHKKVQLGACNGYVRVREVHVKSPNATGAEKSEIEKLLKNGVFIND